MELLKYLFYHLIPTQFSPPISRNSFTHLRTIWKISTIRVAEHVSELSSTGKGYGSSVKGKEKSEVFFHSKIGTTKFFNVGI